MTQHTGGGLSNTKTRFKGHIEEKMEFSVVFRPSVASPFGSIHEQVSVIFEQLVQLAHPSNSSRPCNAWN
jgi:hypothetical protein